MTTHTMQLPLGNSVIRSPNPDLAELRRFICDCESIQFSVIRTNEKAFQINIKYKRVRGASGVFDYEETIGGLIGDHLRLLYGDYLTIGHHGKLYLEVTFESKHHVEAPQE